MAEPSSSVARRPLDCWIPGTPTPSCFFQVPRFSPGHEAIGL
ncbi:Glutamate synthase 1 [NADH] chloroplastic [Zea mays]|uniref:Glutamate synthase 1 [NADH] chloroplastic n=2 Tax=Zea mays TaxID=4577 RepID=A0A1D6Q430_MAIZE|nr:Putative cytochrome P450 superfamily protein [Zea mays]AQK83216.1 Glutamate synthase 1 [NADH] chloroplastic [Zea mays]